MKNWKAAVFASAAMLSIAVAAPAAASHDHYLSTPGTCIGDVAHGQTDKGLGEGGYHQFHDHVHKDQPGTTALVNPHNPVAVDKGSCPAT